jgi:hypothetical protein
MRLVHLRTDLGVYVTAVEIPPFTTGNPAVLLWGVRVFVREGESDSDLYRETFAYAVPYYSQARP